MSDAVRNMEMRFPTSREIIKVCGRSIFACACAHCALDMLECATRAWKTIHARVCVSHVRLGEARGYCPRCPSLTLGHDMRYVAVAVGDHLKVYASRRVPLARRGASPLRYFSLRYTTSSLCSILTEREIPGLVPCMRATLSINSCTHYSELGVN